MNASELNTQSAVKRPLPESELRCDICAATLTRAIVRYDGKVFCSEFCKSVYKDGD